MLELLSKAIENRPVSMMHFKETECGDTESSGEAMGR